MKPIIISLLTVGTTLAGYTVYQSSPNQLAPLVSRIQTILPSYEAPAPAPTYSVQTASTQPTSIQVPTSQAGPAQAASGPTYVELLNPHVQAAFAPLEVDRGNLSEEPILQLREWFLRVREREGAVEAIAMLDRLLWIMRERERFRERLDNPGGTSSDEFFRERIRQEWLARIKELELSFNRDWAVFAAHEVRIRERFVGYHHDREYFDAYYREEYRPRYGEHLGEGYVFVRPVEWGHHTPIDERHNPLEVHHNPIDERHNPLEVHHNPFEEHHNPLEVGHNPIDERHAPFDEHHNPLEVHHNPLDEHHNPLDRGPYHNPLETNNRPEIGSTNHPTTTGGTALNHPTTGSHPTTTVSHPVVHPTTVVVPVAGAGGA